MLKIIDNQIEFMATDHYLIFVEMFMKANKFNSIKLKSVY